VKPMNVCLLNAGFDTCLKSPEQLLSRYWHVPKLAAALAEHGHQVTAIQAFHRNESLQRGKVAVELIATENSASAEWAEITRFGDVARKLESYRPDIVHFFGLTMLPLRRALGRWCAERGVSLTASFHGGRPSRNPLARRRQRQALSQISTFFFSNAAAVEPWRAAGLIPDKAQIMLLPEVSSPFTGLPKHAARRTLGVDGDPVFVWSGRLHPDKDPMTTLQGLQRIIRSWPNTRLLMAFQSEEMLPEIKAILACDSALKRNVSLLGALKHSDMETLFSAADFFVHSSRREWGSNSLVEALSCGAIPVVSDIPSLRALTEAIEPAIRFQVGDAEGLARQVLKLQIDGLDRLSKQVKSTFDAHLSYPVLAARYSTVFESLVSGHTSGSQL